MKNKKYKILVLSDLKKSATNTLKSTVSLAKIIDADITFFHVKKPIDILKTDNQLSAMRTINQENSATDKKIQKLIAPIKEAYDVNINYSFAFGNVKNEIERSIKAHQPDIIVLGKRKSKSIIGDKVTQFVLKKHPGVIMIAANKNTLDPNKKLALGVFNGTDETINLEFAEDLIAHTKKPLKSFKIAEKTSSSKEVKDFVELKADTYVFEQNNNAINNISNYLLKNDINLLYIDREKCLASNKAKSKTADINNAIKKFDVSLLLIGEQKQRVQ
jgi:nucleotide-binding universal stress UspA family protein